MGSKAALLRAMQRTDTPICRRVIYKWIRNSKSIQLCHLINLARVMNITVDELVNQITIKHEGDE